MTKNKKSRGGKTFSGNHHGLKWLIFSFALLAVVVVAIVLNLNHTVDDTNKIAGVIDVDNGDSKINWERYQTVDVNLSESLKIIESGTYHISGSLDGGMITIDAGVGEVRLILDNVTINNTSGPAIYCSSAEDVVIELNGNNYLSDGDYYSDYEDDVTGTIYSKADLTFQGEGSLTITGNFQDAIVGKDDVKFNSGVYMITAKDDGVRGKDSVYVVSGDFVIDSGADAIKVTNELDSGKGFVLIESGNFAIDASAKGIKATKSILIYDGNFTITSYDDSIHSNNYVGIVGGDYVINAGDDGIHADRELIVDGGDIVIIKAYEGLEAQVITVNSGTMSITATDDGLNAGGGADESAMNRPGAGPFNADTSCILSINGGQVYVNASGDGIDSNGYLYFNGGNVEVDGPTNSGNGALDAGAGIVMSGGKVVAVGASGMAESLGSDSSIFNINVYFESTQPANTKIEIKDNNGEVLISHTSAKTFNHMATGCEKFQLGSTYTIYLNDEFYKSFTVSDIVTTVGNSNTNQMMPQNNGPQNRR